ncbi:MAG: hypothetical protein U9R19_08185 [Bacteroidota bacterium]|nr:hypothetical protein [Bacteroidota bacterium]
MDIEKIIQDNREAFDISEPDDGHFARFNLKLDEKFSKKKKRIFVSYLKIAAVFALVLMSTFWLYEKFSSNPVQQKNGIITLSEISPDYAEVEFFYTSNINTSLDELSRNFSEGDKLKSKLLNSEFEHLDSLYRGLQKELALNPNDEQIIDAMIVHYRTKLEIILTVLNQLQKAKTLKTNYHEKNEM